MSVNVGYRETPGEPKLRPLVLYHYHPTRSGSVPLSVLAGYHGHLQTDGYEAYDETGRQPGMIHVGCWAHVRRKFFDASKIGKKAGSAEVALAFIAELYRIEQTLREKLTAGTISREEFVATRSAQSTVQLERFAAWIAQRVEQVPPKTTLGEALSYAQGQWQRLLRYLDAWYLTPDNNAAERAIRPFVVGRKNWLFSDTPRGAHASAALYSLVETAKANGLEPYAYLRYLFSRLPAASTREDYLRLLPTAMTVDDLFNV